MFSVTFHLADGQIMKTDIFKEEERGKAKMEWLDARYYFSFGNFYYDRNRMHFGVLRVINDDIIAAGRGFGEHPHDNMEIITIPWKGSLQHKDSIGNTSIIRPGDIQVMSAGKGVFHSEFNPSPHEETRLFQIWLYPQKRDVLPRYDQWSYEPYVQQNTWTKILSPNPDEQGVWVHQAAWFHLGIFEKHASAKYQIHRRGNGVFAIVVQGSAEIGGKTLKAKDAIGIWDTEAFNVTALTEDTRILLLDVPMSLDAIAA